MKRPLKGYRLVEFAGIGPGPMAAMLLADMGATVLRPERPAAICIAVSGIKAYGLIGKNP